MIFINKYFKEELTLKNITEAFAQLFTETIDRQGWKIPKPLQIKMVHILAEKFDRPDWEPKPSYAELYFQIHNPTALRLLGDTCWFTRAVFPQLGERKGISAAYYTDLGQSCYGRLLSHIGPDYTLTLMIQHFNFLAEVAWTVIHSQGNFREMWSDD